MIMNIQWQFWDQDKNKLPILCNKTTTLSVYYLVFHRILDFKRGWISILALFLCLERIIQGDPKTRFFRIGHPAIIV